MSKLTEQENYELASKLRSEVENWVDRTFNFINVSVYEKLSDGCLLDYIGPESADVILDRFSEYVDKETYQTILKEAEEKGFDLENADEVISFIQDSEYRDQFEDCRSEVENDNYPVWSTLFEFRNTPSDGWIEKAKGAGFGVITGVDDFYITLFLSGAGYSFYAQHWIPLYLSLFEWVAKEYAGVNYQMV